jgi:hypothetical protein
LPVLRLPFFGPCPAKQTPHHADIVERHDRPSDRLALFVALASYREQVTRTQFR